MADQTASIAFRWMSAKPSSGEDDFSEGEEGDTELEKERKKMETMMGDLKLRTAIDQENEARPSQAPFVVAQWLRKHGRSVPTELSKKQKTELRDCFNMIDADGSGAIDVEEMQTAFQFLGVRMRAKEVEVMFAEVDDDGSGEIEFEEFIQIMTNVNEKLGDDNGPAAADEDKPPEEESERPLPFPMMAMAYKRRKLMEAAFDPEVRLKVMKDAQTKREAENKAYLEEAKRVYQRMKEEKSQKKSMITKMTERMDKSLAREAQRRNEAKRVDHLAMRRLETTRLAARNTHARHNPDLLFSLPVFEDHQSVPVRPALGPERSEPSLRPAPRAAALKRFTPATSLSGETRYSDLLYHSKVAPVSARRGGLHSGRSSGRGTARSNGTSKEAVTARAATDRPTRLSPISSAAKQAHPPPANASPPAQLPFTLRPGVQRALRDSQLQFQPQSASNSPAQLHSPALVAPPPPLALDHTPRSFRWRQAPAPQPPPRDDAPELPTPHAPEAGRRAEGKTPRSARVEASLLGRRGGAGGESTPSSGGRALPPLQGSTERKPTRFGNQSEASAQEGISPPHWDLSSPPKMARLPEMERSVHFAPITSTGPSLFGNSPQ